MLSRTSPPIRIEGLTCKHSSITRWTCIRPSPCLKANLAKIPNVLTNPAPDVEILTFTLAGPVLAVRPYCDNKDYWQVYFDTNRTFAIRSPVLVCRLPNSISPFGPPPLPTNFGVVFAKKCNRKSDLGSLLLLWMLERLLSFYFDAHPGPVNRSSKAETNELSPVPQRIQTNTACRPATVSSRPTPALTSLGLPTLLPGSGAPEGGRKSRVVLQRPVPPGSDRPLPIESESREKEGFPVELLQFEQRKSNPDATRRPPAARPV